MGKTHYVMHVACYRGWLRDVGVHSEGDFDTDAAAVAHLTTDSVEILKYNYTVVTYQIMEGHRVVASGSL